LLFVDCFSIFSLLFLFGVFPCRGRRRKERYWNEVVGCGLSQVAEEPIKKESSLQIAVRQSPSLEFCWLKLEIGQVGRINFDRLDGERIRVDMGEDTKYRGGLRKVMLGKVKCLFVLLEPSEMLIHVCAS